MGTSEGPTKGKDGYIIKAVISCQVVSCLDNNFETNVLQHAIKDVKQ